MPILKRRLTRSEQFDHLARAKQMRAAGVDVQIRDEWWEAARPLNVTITPFHSHVYDLQRGGAAYAVWVRLVAKWQTTVTHCELLTEVDCGIELIEFDDCQPSLSLRAPSFSAARGSQSALDEPPSELPWSRPHGRRCNLVRWPATPARPAAWHGPTLHADIFDPNENESCKAGEVFVDRTGKPRNQPLSRPSGLYDDEISVTSRPLFPQRVPDEFPVNRVGQKEIKSEPRESMKEKGS